MSASPNPTSRTARSCSPLPRSRGEGEKWGSRPPLAGTIASNMAALRRLDLMSGSFPRLRLALPHVAEAFAGNCFRVGRVVEDLDRHPAAIRAVEEGLEDRHEVDGTE